VPPPGRSVRELREYFAATGRHDQGDCGESIGLWFSICAVASIVPYVGCVASLACLVLLIVYLLKMNELRKLVPEGAATTSYPLVVEAQPTAMQTSICPQCGAQQPGGGAFCVSCGGDLIGSRLVRGRAASSETFHVAHRVAERLVRHSLVGRLRRRHRCGCDRRVGLPLRREAARAAGRGAGLVEALGAERLGADRARSDGRARSMDEAGDRALDTLGRCRIAAARQGRAATAAEGPLRTRDDAASRAWRDAHRSPLEEHS
jgi:hypothetical protein